MHAHGSLPFSSLHVLRACASLMLSNSKNASQYGRSSCSGVAQKPQEFGELFAQLPGRAKEASESRTVGDSAATPVDDAATNG